MTPPRRGVQARAIAALFATLIALAGVSLTPATAGAAEGTDSFVTMVGEPGDYIGGNTSAIWRTGTGDVGLDGSVETGQIAVSVAGGPAGTTFGFSFAAPQGEALATGVYADAQRFRDESHPQIDISGDGRGCNETSGSFTILDMDAELTKLWLVYEQHCEGGEPAVFGEIRINEPAADADLLVAAGHVAWPAAYPHVARRNVPVRLYNTGASPVTVSSAAITAGSGSFAVKSSSCSVIPVAGSCTVSVGFTPDSAGAKVGTLTIADSTSTGTHTVELAGTGIAGHTSWAMRSQPGDYIGGGQDWSYTPTNATITARGDQTHWSLSVADNWTADFEAPSGRSLVAGETFTSAIRYPFNASTQPGMDVSGHGRGCNTVKGSFTIIEAEYDDAGRLLKASLNFTQHCEGGAPALFGSIAWKADSAAQQLPPKVTVTTDRSSYRFGQSATVTAKLSADSPIRTLSIYATPRGGAKRLVKSGTVDASGRLSVKVAVAKRTTFTVAFDGQGELPDLTVTKAVSVAAKVTPTAEKAKGKSGQYYVYSVSKTAWVRGTVSPNHAGDCLYFRAQFKVNGRWGYDGTTKCVHMAPTSYAKVYLPGNKNYLGIPIRMRAEWRGDADNTATNSSWVYVKFVK